MKLEMLGLLLGALLVASPVLRTSAADNQPAAKPVSAESAPAVPDAKAEAEKAGATNQAVVIHQYARLLYKIEEDPKAGDPEMVPLDALGEAWFRVTRGSDKTLPPMKVAGRTLDEIRTDLKAALDKDFYVDCTVRLTLESNGATPFSGSNVQGAPGRVLFIGPTLRGPVILPPGTKKTISEAVLELPADQYANLRKVEIERYDSKTGKSKKIKVDVQAILHEGKRDQDVEVLDGDRITVPEKFFLIN